MTDETPDLAAMASEFIDAALSPKLNNPVISTPADHGLDYEESSSPQPTAASSPAGSCTAAPTRS